MAAKHLAPHSASARARTRLSSDGDTQWAEHPLHVMTFGCDLLADAEPHALGITYWFGTAPDGEPYPVSIRFAGRRIGVKGKTDRRDSFTVVETLNHVIPGSGPIAITTRVFDIASGEWHVTAAPIHETRGQAFSRVPRSKDGPRLSSASSSGLTAFAPAIRMRAPGVRFGAWPALVAIGVAVALGVQAVLVRRTDLPATRVLLVSLLASLVGLIGAKIYYLTEHRGRRESFLTAGMCIQGFVLGAIAVLVAGSLLVDAPVGPALDVSTPGLLFGMTIGRFGCFFGGCCAGRPTRSRWGLWSSDRHLGVRRIPTQLLESAIALTIGGAALFVVWSGSTRTPGTVFVEGIAAYTLGRQLLFPLRDIPRHTTHGRTLTAVAAATLIVLPLVDALFR